MVPLELVIWVITCW